jgi:ABC-type phosphate transport system substrate-binding protein
MTEIPARSGDQEQDLGRDEVQILDPEPALLIQENFSRCAISFHYVLLNELGSGRETAPNPFSSFERDLLAHSFRDSSLICSDVLLGHRFPMTVTFPSEVQYSAEGKEKSLPFGQSEKTVEFQCTLTRTTFPSPINSGMKYREHSILHATLLLTDKDIVIHEFDLIQLIKYWEGGEGMGNDAPHAVRKILKFNQHSCLEDAIINQLYKVGVLINPEHSLLKSPLCGSIQLDLVCRDDKVKIEWQNLLTSIDWKTQADKNEYAKLDRPKIKALAGILQGLIDFPYIETAELKDVFNNATLDSGEYPMMMAIHKGTLLQISSNCRLMDLKLVRECIGISPYLIIPHAVLAYHESLLSEAAKSLKNVLAKPLDKKTSKQRLDSVQSTQIQLREDLEVRWLPNVFHYPTERNIFENGHSTRGLIERRIQLINQINYLVEKINADDSMKRRGFEDNVQAFGLKVGIWGLVAAVFSLGFSYLTGAIEIGANLTRLTKGVPLWEIGNIRDSKIRIDGSRLVYPFLRDVIDQYQASEASQKITFELNNGSTAAGFQQFCRQKLDIVAASRSIEKSETELCKFNAMDYHQHSRKAPFPIAREHILILTRIKEQAFSSDHRKPLDFSFANIKLIEQSNMNRPYSLRSLGENWPDIKIQSCTVATTDGRLSSRREFLNEHLWGTDQSTNSLKHKSVPDGLTMQRSFLGEISRDSPMDTNNKSCSFFFVNQVDWQWLKDNYPAWTLDYRLLDTHSLPKQQMPLDRTFYLYVSRSRLEQNPEIRRFLEFLFDTTKQTLTTKHQEKESGYGLIPLEQKAYDENKEELSYYRQDLFSFFRSLLHPSHRVPNTPDF